MIFKGQNDARTSLINTVYILAERCGEGSDSIICNYCTCRNGARTVGCCAHVIIIIWYLGYAENLEGGIHAQFEHLDTLQL